MLIAFLSYYESKQVNTRLGPIIRLRYGPERNSKFCFLESPDVSRNEVVGNIRENKTNCFPRDHTLSAFLYVKTFP